MTIIFVLLDIEYMDRLLALLRRRISAINVNLRIIVGRADFNVDEGEAYGFTPYEELKPNSI